MSVARRRGAGYIAGVATGAYASLSRGRRGRRRGRRARPRGRAPAREPALAAGSRAASVHPGIGKESGAGTASPKRLITPATPRCALGDLRATRRSVLRGRTGPRTGTGGSRPAVEPVPVARRCRAGRRTGRSRSHGAVAGPAEVQLLVEERTVSRRTRAAGRNRGGTGRRGRAPAKRRGGGPPGSRRTGAWSPRVRSPARSRARGRRIDPGDGVAVVASAALGP